MTLPETFADVLRNNLEGTPPTIGYFDRRRRAFDIFSFDDVLARAAATARALRDAGTAPGQPVMVVAIGPEPFWEGFLGAVLAGACPVLMPLRPTFDSEELVRGKLALSESRMPTAQLLLQRTESGPCIDPGSRRWVAIAGRDRSDDIERALKDVGQHIDDPLHLQFTSGSTGDLRPVLLTQRNVMASTSSLATRMGLGPRDHIVSWLPLYHDMGLVGMALASVAAGAHLRLLSPFDFLADPTNWLGAIAQAEGAVTAAPNFAFDYTTRRAKFDESRDLDLSTWKKCYCGAEPVDSATIAAFLERFGPFGLRPEAVHPTYGLAEATLMVTMPSTGEEPKEASIAMAGLGGDGPVELRSVGPMRNFEPASDPTTTSVACLGRAADGVTVEIVDAESNPVVGERISGEVVVTGDAVAPGYLQADGAIDPLGRRLHTGDVGFLHDGELYLIERRRNIIIRHGQNYSAAAFERHLAHRLGVSLDAIAVLQEGVGGDEIIAVVESTRNTPRDQLVALAHEVGSDLRLPIDDVVIVGRNKIPRTTSGKKQHTLLRTALRSGALPVIERIGVSSREVEANLIIDLRDRPVRQRVLDVVARYARRGGWVGPLNDDSTGLVDLGLDSLATIEMVVDIDVETGCVIPEARLGELVTLGDVLRMATTPATKDEGVASAVTRLSSEIPQVYRTVQRQEERQVLIDGRWYTDFGSVNYLGLDLRPDVQGSIGPAVERWGTHPSWTRAVASPEPYARLEGELASLIGAADAMVFSTTTLAHIGLLPLLASGNDTIVLDRSAHNSVVEGAELAAARGADLQRFDHRDLTTLGVALGRSRGRPVVCVDGVYSMTGSVADLPTIVAMTEEAGGLLYVDDAHGFGVLGRQPAASDPYGRGGGGVVRMLDLDYRNIVYVAGMSKAFSSMAAFVSCSDESQRELFERASTSIFSGPIPVASMATALAGLEVNALEGDRLRAHLHDVTSRALDGASELGFSVDNSLAFPIINLLIGGAERTVAASRIMWDEGILFTPSIFPAVALDRGGFRISLTATHRHEDVDKLLRALDRVVTMLGRSVDLLSGSPTQPVGG